VRSGQRRGTVNGEIGDDFNDVAFDKAINRRRASGRLTTKCAEHFRARPRLRSCRQPKRLQRPANASAKNPPGVCHRTPPLLRTSFAWASSPRRSRRLMMSF
jgi:hypothetical protein